MYGSTNRENHPVLTDEPVKFEKEPVKVEDFGEIMHHLRGICGIYPSLIIITIIIKTKRCQCVTNWTWKH